MKALYLTPLFALVPAATAQATNTHLEAAMAVHRAWLSTLQEITAVMNNVKDKETADAAAPKIHELAERLQLLQKEAAGFAPPSAAEEAAYRAAINTAEIKKTVDAFMQAIITSAQAQTYGSAELSKALENLLGRGL